MFLLLALILTVVVVAVAASMVKKRGGAMVTAISSSRTKRSVITKASPSAAMAIPVTPSAATRAARASLPGHWAVCMLLWAHPRGPIADPLLYLGHCRPHLPSPRYFADFPPYKVEFTDLVAFLTRFGSQSLLI